MIPDEIQAYLVARFVLTLSTSRDNIPYSASLYYAPVSAAGHLVFKSDPDTRHARELADNSHVAGTVHHEPGSVGQIQGIQFQGTCYRVPAEGADAEAYKQRFPFAEDFPGEYYVIQLSEIKMTDNTVRFGYKRLWSRV